MENRQVFTHRERVLQGLGGVGDKREAAEASYPAPT
jgi:hypothetical protein